MPLDDERRDLRVRMSLINDDLRGDRRAAELATAEARLKVVERLIATRGQEDHRARTSKASKGV